MTFHRNLLLKFQKSRKFLFWDLTADAYDHELWMSEFPAHFAQYVTCEVLNIFNDHIWRINFIQEEKALHDYSQNFSY